MLGLRADDPRAKIISIGDLNALESTDGDVDAVGQIAGTVEPADNLLSGPNLVNLNLMNQVNSLPLAEHYSFIVGGTAQVLDHVLTSQAPDFRVDGLRYACGNADAAEILHDHGAVSTIQPCGPNLSPITLMSSRHIYRLDFENK